MGREIELGSTALWTRVNALESPWVLDDLTQLVSEIGDRLEVIMVPKVEGPWDIHYVDRLLAQLEAKAGLERPILVHAILETVAGRDEPRGDRRRQPAHAGHELRPGRPGRLAAHEDHARRRRAPGLPRDRGPRPRRTPDAPRASAQQDPWHYSIARMVDACTAAGILPFYGPYGDIKDVLGCETQFRAAFLLGCVGAWSLHPVQIDIAKKVFSPDPDEVAFAKKVIEAIPDGARRAHDRRQDAGRRDLEAVQGDGRPRRAAGRQGPRARRGLRDGAGRDHLSALALRLRSRRRDDWDLPTWDMIDPGSRRHQVFDLRVAVAFDPLVHAEPVCRLPRAARALARLPQRRASSGR